MAHFKIFSFILRRYIDVFFQPECMFVVAEASVIDTLYTRSVFELNCNHRQDFLPVHVYLVLVFSFTFLRYFRYVMWSDRRRIHISATSFLFHLHAGEAGEVHVQRFFQSESPVKRWSTDLAVPGSSPT